MKTESLQICIHEHAQPATCSGCGVAELLPWTWCFQKVRWKSHHANWPLEVRPIQISVRDLNFPKETNEERNGSPVQPTRLSGCKHTWVRSKSKLCAGTLHSPLSPAGWVLPCSAAQPLPTWTHTWPWCTPKKAAPSAEPVAYSQLQHQWHQEDAALQSQSVSFPSSENQGMEKANKPWRDFLFL